MLNSTIGMLDTDHGGMEDRRMAKARELGVMDEWVEYTYGKRALWPDRCVITNLPSDKALTPTAMPLCKCEACQNWAATTIRDLHTQVVNPVRNRDRDKALAAIQEIIATE
ncbi:unnamed protein product [marine sediment metagenome]|uniref:Uncharacterized protein n=1 Tax=marine sediment metagenome TaxID=412755 RepID=X0RTQ9_9ZZZZ